MPHKFTAQLTTYLQIKKGVHIYVYILTHIFSISLIGLHEKNSLNYNQKDLTI